jgi:1,2-diacylglycerol 3-alpha-glucosyltransferase
LKILFAADTYHPDVNGAAYFSHRLATLLAKRGHEVSFICPSQSLHNQISMQDGVRVLGFGSVPLPLYPDRRLSPPLFAKRPIREFLRQNRPDVIHLQDHFFLAKAVLGAAEELRIPIMGTNHFLPENVVHHLHLSAKGELLAGAFLWSRFVQIYKRMYFVTAPTVTAATLSNRPGLGQEVIPISSGVDLNRFHPGYDASEIKKKHLIPDRKILMCVGRLDREKRVEVAIRAMPGIVARVDAHLVIAGKGKLRAALEDLAGKLGVKDRVTFLGFLPDVDLPKVYGLADVFVMPGVAELQSSATMEAMASGLPVIAADAMALPELVHHGENGLLFPQDDARELALAAARILSEQPLRDRMAQKSLEIIQIHALGQVVESYEALYRQMIGVESAPELPSRRRRGHL